jgi:hypothetical protein
MIELDVIPLPALDCGDVTLPGRGFDFIGQRCNQTVHLRDRKGDQKIAANRICSLQD